MSKKALNYFTQKVLDLGNVKSTDTVNWKFDVEEEFFDYGFEYVHTGCTCTTLKGMTEQSIWGTINVATSGYNKDNGMMYKTITACFNDGENEYVADPTGKRVVNPNKMRQNLVIKANVIN